MTEQSGSGQQEPDHASAHVGGQGRLFRSGRDQYIAEYHSHVVPTLGALWEQQAGPDSVRTPLIAGMRSPIRDRLELRRHLLNVTVGNPPADAVQLVHGMPGCGKSAVALTVFDEAVGSHGIVGLWVNAASAASFRDGMLAVASDRGAAQDEVDAARARTRPAADLVWHYLDRSPERWLLVVDNADDPELFQHPGWLRASSRGTVLVTTRRGDASPWRSSERHPLGVLSVPDAVAVLLDLNVGDGDLSGLERLAHSLDCHPLALMLAGSFLGQQVLEPVTVADYVQRLHEGPSAVLDLGAEPGEQDLRRLISTTWQLSLDALAGQGVPETTTLLRVLSCFASDPLPVGLITPTRLDNTSLAAADPALHGGQANAVVRALLSQSLVTVQDVPGDAGCPSVRTVQAHALLLDTVAARVPLDQRDLVLTSAAALLESVLSPADEEAAFLDSQTLRLFAPHASALLRRVHGAGEATRARALELVRGLRAQSYARGDYAAAHALAVDAADAAGQEATPDSLADQYELGRALTGVGRFAEAADLHQRVLSSRESLLGSEHADTLSSVHALALAHYGLGRWAENEQHMRQAAEGRQRLLGPDHPATLESWACLSDVLGEQGRWSEAEAVARPNLRRSEDALGLRHPHTLQCRIALAWVLFKRDRCAEAGRLARATRTGSQKVLGRDHPRTLAAGQLLSGILLRGGDYEEAEGVARAVLETRERVLGPEHPHTLAIRIRLARILLTSGRQSPGYALVTDTLSVTERILGPDHPDTVSCRLLREEFPPPAPEPSEEAQQ